MEYGKLQKAERRANQQKLNLTGIPTQMKWDLEARSGLSLDDVQVHYHSEKPAKLGALAYTQGTQVHIAPGQEGHLPHELGHVVQQKLGLVRANARFPGGPALNTEEALERQADEIGAGRSMPGAGMPVVQRREEPVVQAAGHLQSIARVVPGEDKLSLPSVDMPTVVFEAMGVDEAACTSIYEQTTDYKGNTVCVFGLNMATKPSDDKKRTEEKFKEGQKKFAEAQKRLPDYQKKCNTWDEKGKSPRHMLFTFSFQWDPILSEESRGYHMPFVEARILVMAEAQRIIDKIKDPAAALPALEQKFLYRWIDADAENDTTASLAPSRLNAFAEERGATIMTGRYDWRSLTAEAFDMPVYEDFLGKFNKAEQKLRKFWYELWNNKKTASKKFSGSSAQETPLSLFNKGKDLYLPGFYLPETVLMMDETVHKFLLNSYKGTVGAQDKESMQLVSLLKNYNTWVDYQEELSVTKPLKNEFADSGTYWGADMQAFLTATDRGADKSEHAFVVALKNVRQSAFNPGNWYFVSDSEWNDWEKEKKSESEEEDMQAKFNKMRKDLEGQLFKFLDDNRQTKLKQISREILKPQPKRKPKPKAKKG